MQIQDLLNEHRDHIDGLLGPYAAEFWTLAKEHAAHIDMLDQELAKFLVDRGITQERAQALVGVLNYYVEQLKDTTETATALAPIPTIRLAPKPLVIH